MRFSLDVLRARKGDCLMLHYGTKSSPHLFMIDGGPSDVYKPQLKPRLTQLRKARGLAADAPLPVDVLMVSHVDDDHIKGVLDLTKELRAQKTNREPQLLRVTSLWHNCFDDLLDTTPEELTAEAGFGTAALEGTIDLEDQEQLDVAKVLASIPQGRTLRDDATFLAQGTQDWKVNHKFGGKLILAGKASQPVSLGGVTFTVIGPMQPELEALRPRSPNRPSRPSSTSRSRTCRASCCWPKPRASGCC
jgi:glyoxylase-like metal-dependent hydrolase (beta-lactamase superfamily II)